MCTRDEELLQLVPHDFYITHIPLNSFRCLLELLFYQVPIARHLGSHSSPFSLWSNMRYVRYWSQSEMFTLLRLVPLKWVSVHSCYTVYTVSVGSYSMPSYIFYF